MHERGQYKGEFIIHKYANRQAYLARKPYAVSKIQNVMLNEGIQEIEDFFASVSTAAVAYAQANTALGVGDSTASSGVATSTGLLSTANTLYVAVSTGYPTRSNQTLTWRSVFSSVQANFNWREFTARNSLTATGRNRNLNRAVSNHGTKASGQTWTLDLQLTIS